MCDNAYTDDDFHITGKYGGLVHTNCNIKVQLNSKNLSFASQPKMFWFAYDYARTGQI